MWLVRRADPRRRAGVVGSGSATSSPRKPSLDVPETDLLGEVVSHRPSGLGSIPTMFSRSVGTA